MEGAILRSPCPMVVTLHDLSALKRAASTCAPGVRLRLRYLAVQRAVRVIVPTEAVARRRRSAPAASTASASP